MNFSPFPVLETERLVLRQLVNEDVDTLYQLRTDENVNKYLDRPVPENIEEVRTFINKITKAIEENKSIYWVIAMKSKPEPIGTICLWNFSADGKEAETGYELSPSFQGQGIMKEAFSRVMDYGFNILGLKAIEAYTHRGNLASTKLLEKHRFRLEENRKDDDNPDNIIFRLSNPSR